MFALAVHAGNVVSWRRFHTTFMKTTIIILLCAGAFAFNGCATKHAAEESVATIPWIWECKSFTTNFDTGKWTFVIGTNESLGFPVEAFINLYAKNENGYVLIKEPADMNQLSGIKINNAEDALNFVRMFTRPDNHDLRDSYYLFDVPNAKEINHETTTVVRDKNTFIVTRTLVYDESFYDSGYFCPVAIVKESVTVNGKYTLLSKKIMDPMPWRETGFLMYM